MKVYKIMAQTVALISSIIILISGIVILLKYSPDEIKNDYYDTEQITNNTKNNEIRIYILENNGKFIVASSIICIVSLILIVIILIKILWNTEKYISNDVNISYTICAFMILIFSGGILSIFILYA